ncbi:hypothetical protein Aduo_013642 [Ancylostoma duodenale]
MFLKETGAVSGQPPYLSQMGFQHGQMGGQGQQIGLTGPPMGQMGAVNGQSGLGSQGGLRSGQPPMGGAAPQQ